MIRRISIFTTIVVLLVLSVACKSPDGDTHKLSIIIDRDSIHVYHGKFSEGTDVEHYPADPLIIKKILADNKREHGDELAVIIKPADKGIGGSYRVVEAFMSTTRMAIEMGIPYEPARLDSSEAKLLDLETLVLQRPQPLKLYLPDGQVSQTKNVGPQQEITDPAKVNPAYIATLIAAKEEVFYYNGKLTSRDQLKTEPNVNIGPLVHNLKHDIGDSLLLVVKSAETAEYKSIISILDEIERNEITRYALVDVTPKEEELLGLRGFSYIQTDNELLQLPDNNNITAATADLTLILRSDGSIYYMMSNAGITQPVQVKPASVKNIVSIIQEAERKYAKKGPELTVVIQAGDKAKYGEFKLMVEALKQKEMFQFKIETINKDN